MSSEATSLLSSSGSLSRKSTDTKKQRLKKLLQRERAGIQLTEEESDFLYPERIVEESSPQTTPPTTQVASGGKKEVISTERDDEEKKSQKKKKKKEIKLAGKDVHVDTSDAKGTDETVAFEGPESQSLEAEKTTVGSEKVDSTNHNEGDVQKKSNPIPDTEKSVAVSSSKCEGKPGFNFASQMMASLHCPRSRWFHRRKREQKRQNRERKRRKRIHSHPAKHMCQRKLPYSRQQLLWELKARNWTEGVRSCQLLDLS